MLAERLNSLLLLYVHKDIRLDYDDIVNDYARKNPRKMVLLNPLADNWISVESIF